ncbi:DUF1929 domain-containing protein [Cyanobacteria bacterium FACHB-63]|nr:DUF1929 domain-containing protein [Cyanobacteria bacterium FACHB-63]
MVNLLPPRIKGPISECSTHIRVQSQFPGASVEVVDTTSGGVVAAGASAASADELFPVTGGLIPGHRLAARQTLGTDISGLSADTVEVQRRPNPVRSISFVTPLVECAKCLWLEGAVPGATVEVRDGGSVIGSAVAYDGVARVQLSQRIRSTSHIQGQQTACGVPGTVTNPPGPLPAIINKQGRSLPPPTVEDPLIECSQRVTVSDVLPGATVELERSAGPGLSACFDLPSLWFGVSPHLATGETVRARQIYRECEQESPWSSAVVVDPLSPVPVPTTEGPLCKNGTSVTVCGLKAGARVRITIAPHHHGGFPVGGTVYEAFAPEDGCFDFPFTAPGLPGDSQVYVTQELCGRQSAPSNVVSVDPIPDVLPELRVTEPLFECSTVVHVENLHPGSRVYVVSTTLGEIGQKQCFNTEEDVTVAPLLVADDEIYAYAIGCGMTSPESNRVRVGRVEQLEPPQVAEPLYSCQTTVKVINVVPGAWVDIYINGQWRGRAKAGKSEVDVPVQIGKLEVGNEVSARQSLCERMSDFGRAIGVQKYDGRWFRVGDETKSEILAVHAALLPTGKIVIFAGDQYDSANRLPNSPKVDHTRLMETSPPFAVRSVTGLPPNANLFCCGHALLEDGTVLTGGGTERGPTNGFHGDHWYGPRESWRFMGEPAGGELWEQQGLLNTARPGDVRSGFAAQNSGGRWYPTLITLADGRVLALGGHPLEGDRRHTNTSLELYDPGTKTWNFVGTVDYPNIPGTGEVPRRDNHSEYPRAHVLRDGTVFVASNMADGDVYRWNPSTNPLNWTRVADAPPGGSYSGNPQPYTSVLLALRHETDYTPEVMVCGRETAYTIRPLDRAPIWTPTAGRTMPGTPQRIYPMATLLPTGEVFVSGGTRTAEDSTALKKAEMYDPRSNQWRVLPEMTQVRNYHSTALLMPNGAVWHSGSNRDCEPGPETRDLTVEIYEPWYFCASRPVITGVTSRACAGETINIETPNARKIDEVILVRCGSFTHAFNPDQRLVSVPFERSKETGNLLIASLPNNSAVLIPGYYLLFILSQDVPSEGKFVQVCRSRSRGEMRIEPGPWNRMFDLFEKLRTDPGLLKQVELMMEGQGTTSDAQRLTELEAAVRRIEAKLREEPQGGEKPPITPPTPGGHGGHEGGHNH